ncbi:23S rRNA pseudouridine1911/1915/1917 synthase [Geomicrobium halophilum]|uniref:Pseudouridine synthase n=1 Tax=Geomicrobium halophilum TaxID=549000 RepID=A0A841PKH3_9BACL|nr:RluA family pseudouridine synthase [Geomicrobium halophilum]MBB6449367.1 23S rRNA pseudouridine1911/1915/1917 synthase [Geomicrobium halophilum]
MNSRRWFVEENETNERIDKSLVKAIGESRTTIQQWINNGYIHVNERQIKSNYKLQEGDAIRVTFPPTPETKPHPENIPLDIRYEDNDLLIVNKPRGMVVHPAPGHSSGTLVNALLNDSHSLSDINGEVRPGIVHRLDKDTSGLMVVAKTNQAHLNLREQLQTRTLTRIYAAFVHGDVFHDEGTINAPIGRDQSDRQKMAVTDINAKEAITHFTVMERFSDYTMVQCRLETGRTHQIRVHMAYIGHPLVADPKYGKKKTLRFAGQALHAQQISLIHPRTSEPLTITAPLPEDLEILIDKIRKSR